MRGQTVGKDGGMKAAGLGDSYPLGAWVEHVAGPDQSCSRCCGYFPFLDGLDASPESVDEAMRILANKLPGRRMLDAERVVAPKPVAEGSAFWVLNQGSFNPAMWSREHPGAVPPHSVVVPCFPAVPEYRR